MAQFSVKKNNIDSVISAEGKLANELSSLESEIRGIGNSLGFQVAANANIRNRLNSAANSVSAHRTAMNNMRSALQNTINVYERTENTILGKKSSGRAGILSILGLGFGDSGYSQSESRWNPLDSVNPKVSKKVDPIKGLKDSNLPDNNWWKRTANKISEFNDSHQKQYKYGYYDKDGYHSVDPDSDEAKELKEIGSLKKAATIFSATKKASGSLFDIAEGEGSYGVASGSYNVSALNGYAEAGVYAGIFTYDKDGKKKFTPGIGANAGVGVSAFSAEAEGTIGDEYFNVHGNVSAEVLSAKADAEVNVGLYDKDGNLNPQLSAGVSAEAMVAKASAMAGATIAGTAVNVTGSASFGIGAHADIGLRDGKLSVDVGAALGVGLGVKFDVDFSGTAGFISDKISSGWSEICGWFKG